MIQFATKSQTQETKVLIKNDTKTFTHQVKIPIFSKPTILDMEACNDKRDKCLSTCDDKKNATCKDTCPICPIIKEAPYVLKGYNDTVQSSLESNHKVQNFTTVVRMKNVIHNIIDIPPPPNVNTTNTNYVHIYQNLTSKSGGKYGFGYSQEGQCCMEVHPKTCRMSPLGPKCHHRRRRTCGEHCTSRVVHKRKVKLCHEGSCTNQVRYIAQPDVPRCRPITAWPYITCGGNSKDCEDCFENFDDNDQDAMVPRRCIPCLSQGFDMAGPMYRRGPMFGPSYYNPYYGGYYGGGNGGYPMYNGGGSYPQNDIEDVIGEEAEGSGGYETDFKPSQWTIEARKCKRTYPNGTLEITNCEDVPFENDEFLQNALEFPGANRETVQRRRRRIGRNKRGSRKNKRHHKVKLISERV